jgi:hypothetical protein
MRVTILIGCLLIAGSIEPEIFKTYPDLIIIGALIAIISDAVEIYIKYSNKLT